MLLARRLGMKRTERASSFAARFIVRCAMICVSFALALSFVVGSTAQAPETKKTVAARTETAATAAVAAAPFTPHAPAHDLTGSDVEAFLDGMMPSQLERENVAGAVIAVVKDGHVIFAKGYGYSDMEKRKRVTPDATLFRPGSISKLFTWTSVMQLVEQGKLDLDKDVSQYLDFPIPPAFGKPITLRDILTHTSGYEETARDLFVADAQHLFPLDQYLKNHMPARIFPPFVVPAYSNYATTLAGYIVQRVSGVPFDTYLERNDGKKIFLEEYIPPGKDGFGARFIFLRALNGQPFITKETSEIHFATQYSETLKIDRRFKVADMIYKGELEY